MPFGARRENPKLFETMKSREYKIFQEEERISSLPKTLYEKACNLSARVINIQPDEKTSKAFQEAINFSHLKTTPAGIASLTILFTLLVLAPIMGLIVLNLFFGVKILSFGTGMIVMLLVLPFVYYIYTYPIHLKKKYQIQTGSEIVTMTLYMAMHMRNVPNLEASVAFVADNISGPLALELRKLMWDVEVGNYVSMEDALIDYARKWEDNREFMQATELIIASLKQTQERRVELLNESVNVILLGNSESAKHFGQSLKTPVMVVNALGIILPVLGLILFPLIAVFLDVGAMALFIGYDVILPLILYFVILNILETRPSTFSKISIGDNPELPPEGKFAMGKKFYPAWPFGVLVGAAIFSAGIMVFLLEGNNGIISPILMITGIAMGFAAYYFLVTRGREEIREKTREIENEFGEVLFQMGNQIYNGVPIEMALEQSLQRVKTLKIKDLFSRALNNMKRLGMTFRQAFFDPTYGAVNFYPSRLIKSVMKTVVESSQRGYKTASMAMLSVSRYLRDLHKTQETINDELNDPLSSMKFQVYFLSPLISGVVVTLTIVMLGILAGLAEKIKDLPFGFPLALTEINITNFEFIIIVCVYLLETIFVLSYFTNGIENGEDNIGRQRTTAFALMAGFVIFIVITFITMSLFGPLISAII